MIIKTDQEEIQAYLTDASNVKGNCSAVYFPENAEDVKAALAEAEKMNARVTVSGNGTGLTGSRVPSGGIVIATEKMNRIIELNREELYAVVEPGVLLSDLQKTLEEENLFYAPDPTETNCFIGGTVATNASGAKTFKYGPTRNYVLELEVVLADGGVVFLKRGENTADNLNVKLTDDKGREYKFSLPEINMPAVKNASGYFIKPEMDVIDLFIGSEGTLGVITKIKLRLLRLNRDIISCVVFFNQENDALDFVEKSRSVSYKNRETSGKLDARALEFFDEKSLKFLSEDFPQMPAEAKAAVWFEQEITENNEDELLEQWLELITEFNGNEESVWFASGESERAKIHEFRHAISSKVNEYISRNHLRKLGTDVAVPDENFRELYYYCQNLMTSRGMRSVAYGHFGNSHIHLNMLPENEARFSEGKELYKDICKKAVGLKGTVSAEHGIGKIKTDYLIYMYGEEVVRKMGSLKKELDPGLKLGIGNIISESLYS